MKIQVVAVGKLKERFWKEACDEYLKRLKGYAKVRVDEVPDCDPAKVGGEEGARTKEGRSILEKLPEHSHVILLDVGGMTAFERRYCGARRCVGAFWRERDFVHRGRLRRREPRCARRCRRKHVFRQNHASP